MDKAERNSLVAIPVIVLVGAGVAWAGSQGGALAFGVPGSEGTAILLAVLLLHGLTPG